MLFIDVERVLFYHYYVLTDYILTFPFVFDYENIVIQVFDIIKFGLSSSNFFFKSEVYLIIIRYCYYR